MNIHQVSDAAWQQEYKKKKTKNKVPTLRNTVFYLKGKICE